MAAPGIEDLARSYLDTLPPPAPATRDAHLAALSLPFDRTRYDLAAFRDLVGDVPLLDDPVSVKRRSRDYYWFSPITRPILDGRYADLVAVPREEAEVARVASACARLRIPLVVRGAGTGTYGQAVPLYGGIVLDTSRLDSVHSHDGTSARCGAGARIADVDALLRAHGRELRMHPSTKALATIGGYVCGGSGGIGSVTWGGLREPGNVIGARVVTLEETPRIVDLAGEACGLVNRTFGSTGIVTQVEVALAPARDWWDVVASFPAFEDALAFSHAIAAHEGIGKKLVSTHAPECARFLAAPLGSALRAGEGAVLLMVAHENLEAVFALARAHTGDVTLAEETAAREARAGTHPLYECAWGHTTLHALKVDPTISYLQTLFPPGRVVETALAMWRRFGSELPMHLEFIRYEGAVAANGAQLWPFTSVERLEEIIAIHEEAGVYVANPHVFTVEEGSRHKRVPGDQLGFKQRVDPYGLLNPGKMTSFVPAMPTSAK